MFIGRLDTPEEAMGVENLIGLALPEEDLAHYRHYMERHPRRDEIDRIVAVEDGIVIGCALLIPRTLEWKGEAIDVDEVGFVATHPSYQGRGVMSALLNRTMGYVKERKMALSFIYGIPYFYRRFGYEYAIHDDTFGPYSSIPLSKIKGRAFSSDKLTPEDVKRLDKIFARASAPLSLRAERKPADWFFQEALMTLQGNWESIVFKEKNRLKGYARIQHDSQKLILREMAGEGLEKPENQDRYLKALANRATDGEKELCMGLPPEHPMQLSVERLGGEKKRIHYGAYVKIVSLENLFFSIKASLEKNLEGTEHERYTGTLYLDVYEQGITLIFKNGKITKMGRERAKEDTHIRMPPEILAQLFTGYKTVDQISDVPDVLASREGLALVGSMFPKGTPYLWYGDR
ncbi:MAG: GNAT family N-acetyltransferase [Candidatus Thermoplasmatota archaeon]|nr:GNAT family N-acetyltransferase [Candidatus Thermoplasmatota archaeon]